MVQLIFKDVPRDLETFVREALRDSPDDMLVEILPSNHTGPPEAGWYDVTVENTTLGLSFVRCKSIRNPVNTIIEFWTRDGQTRITMKEFKESMLRIYMLIAIFNKLYK